jgi:hypothetical protein
MKYYEKRNEGCKIFSKIFKEKIRKWISVGANLPFISVLVRSAFITHLAKECYNWNWNWKTPQSTTLLTKCVRTKTWLWWSEGSRFEPQKHIFFSFLQNFTEYLASFFAFFIILHHLKPIFFQNVNFFLILLENKMK